MKQLIDKTRDLRRCYATADIKLMQLNSSLLCPDGADVLYNKFNVTSSTPPENPPSNTNSNYGCVVVTSGRYWKLSGCTDEQRVVCQSG